MIKMK